VLTECDRMPTFLVLKGSTVVETIRGANPSALKAAVNKAVADSAKAPGATGAVFQTKGYTLGSASTPSRPVNQSAFSGLMAGTGGLSDVLVRFFGLYFISLFSLNGYQAAEGSAFNVRVR
jgi:thioredoxin 1